MAKPARRVWLLLAAVAAFVASTLVTPAQAAASLYNQPRYAAIVVDASTGEVLYARRADQPRYPASISKVMTLYLTFEALATGRLKLDDRVTVSAAAARQPPSKLGLRPGESLSVDQALRTVALKSANDIAYALAEKVGGSEARFAALMTLRAHELGMVNTRFVNASGLPDTRQISTARDIAILSRAVMRDYPQYYSYFSQKSYDFQGAHITNHNALLHKMPGVDGIKTGFTNASGYNLAASAVRDGRRLISVVLGGTSTAARDQNVTALLDAGFDVLAKRRAGQAITIASNLNEPDDVSGPVLPSGDDAVQLASAQTAPRLGLTLTGAIPAAAITPGSFSSAWLRPVAFDEAPAAPDSAQGGLKAATLALANDEVDCEPVKVVKTKVVKSKARKGKKARARTVQVVSWQRPKACGPAPQAVLAKASLIKPSEADSLSSPDKAAAPENVAAAEKTKSPATASAGKACASAASAKTRAAKAKRTACLNAGKETETAKAKSTLRGSQPLIAKADGSYAIQVGAYKSQSLAKTQLDKIAKRYAPVVASAASQVQSGGNGNYRARFKGFSASEAKAACQALSAKGEHCMVLSTS